ncbi:tRNA1(Val) (adenine(37)-N6)-methyltransferase [Pseudorhodobacter sp.]|uniref:tRNA1(Val) (adenine(37)-N6)-methyltransferase n=1 Tax=Pseudorhodobacter sp. TaxID=1934400 RepID=UPI0026493E86|nr:methyltransferase [Pseudorhodobacter sp.]MDN5787698.1 methyltransferase [Pseudorhodobacter sp.]
MPFAPEDLTDDAFLGGRLHLWQPRRGYRAATDPVLLAACCNAKPGQSVLDLGCGAGAAALCLGTRVERLDLSGLEVQPAYADLAQRNASRAGIAFEVVEGSILDMPHRLRHGFDHVITNPPYYPPVGTIANDPGRNIALREEISLADWIAAATRRVGPGGWLTLVLRADRLGDGLAAMGPGMGSTAIIPFAPREGRAAGRVVIRARKGGRAALQLLAPFILHTGPEHPGDRDNHSPQAEQVFRHGEGLNHLFT